METLINRELDLRGLSEPVRVLRTRHALCMTCKRAMC